MAKTPPSPDQEDLLASSLKGRLLLGAGGLAIFTVGIMLGVFLTADAPSKPKAAAAPPVQENSVPAPRQAQSKPLTQAIPLTQAFRSPLTARERRVAEQPVEPPVVAALPPAEVAPTPLPAPVRPQGKPLVAIVIDDMGVAQARSARAAALPGPLTLAYLPYAEDLQRQTEAAAQAGHELMVHMPMEPLNADIDPGPYALLSGVDEITLLDLLSWNLTQFEGYAGVNNHMGSRFTADAAGMGRVMAELKRRGLFFLDSVTSPRSQAISEAAQAGVPATKRDVFLDHVDDPAAIRAALRKTVRVALEQGTAIAIGHPRTNTVEVLEEWLNSGEAATVRFVTMSEMMRVRMSGDPRLAFLKP